MYLLHTRSVSGPYLARTKSKCIDTEKTRTGYGSGPENEEKQNNYLDSHVTG